MSEFYSNGKLLLTGEYVVLDGATALAVPTKFGQYLMVEKINESLLVWESYSEDDSCWFEATFDLPKLRLKSATFNSGNEGSSEFIAETLHDILQEARNLNPNFLADEQGFKVRTKLTFPRNWGLGSSSTLLNNIAQWANVDAYQLLWKAFSGSGYDIACAKNNAPILYQLKDKIVNTTQVAFLPEFHENLFFVYLNQKQNSREGIARYKENKGKHLDEIVRISQISNEILIADNLKDFENLLHEHEDIIRKIIHLEPVKKQLFSDYFGEVKSLGAWGGDFVLATGNEKTPSYFKEKGFDTVLSYKDMVL